MESLQTNKRSIFAPKSSLIPRLSESHNRRSSNKIVINVGGVRFETYKTTLKSIPDTRLSWLTDHSGHNPDYDPVTGEYFFDRHSGMFQMILNYYRTGKLHVSMDVCGPAFEEELAFWGLDETQIEPCCWQTYRAHRDAQETLAEFEGTELDVESDNEEEFEMRQKFGISEDFKQVELSRWKKWRPKVWRFLDDPKANKISKTYAVVSVIFILTSIAVFCLETNAHFRYNPHPNMSMNNLPILEQQKHTKPLLFMDVFEYICIIFFTFELLARILFCPRLCDYVKEPFNWIDVCSVVPFYLTKIMLACDANVELTDAYYFLNALRLIRIFRILKLTRHFSGLKILGHTIRASAKELFLLFLVLIIGVLIFACLIFYAEQIDEGKINNFPDIPMGFWWAVVTMTTLGYGDMTPRTGFGYVVGTICAVCGLLMLSLPVPIIVSNFTLYYSHAQAKMKLPKKNRNRLVGAANALKENQPTPSPSPLPETDVSPLKSEFGSKGSLKSLDRKSSNDSAFGSCDSNTSPEREEVRKISVIYTDEIVNSPQLITKRNRFLGNQSPPEAERLPRIPERSQSPAEVDVTMRTRRNSRVGIGYKSVSPAASSKITHLQPEPEM
ncbi:potassium voltage-gated channel protein Shaw-like [Ylistrum balloti]|uniref:potassium voltage-gated channel protein Shaw-like n=1 Tax=Ylistrum balloti TaxID=509963 RepID=UPI002905D1EB|nr:potassium voltage-gated channel protein Shaw-like [Ylistrum balloti]